MTPLLDNTILHRFIYPSLPAGCCSQAEGWRKLSERKTRVTRINLRGGGIWLHRDKRRDRAIQRVGDGTQQLRFAFLDDVVGSDRLGAGIEDILLDLRHGLVESLQRGVDLGKSALFWRQPRNFRTSGPAQPLGSLNKCLVRFGGVGLTRIRRGRQQHTAIDRKSTRLNSSHGYIS